MNKMRYIHVYGIQLLSQISITIRHNMLLLAVAFVLVAMVTAVPEGQAYTDNIDDGQWAYTWYTGEPFYMVCNSSKMNVQPGQYVVWETPNKKVLARPSPNQRYSDANYEVNDLNGIADMELKVVSIEDELHGVYKCTTYNSSDVAHKHMILGLNIHDKKYRDITDKYGHNIAVAFITMCVFIVPLGTIYFVYTFQYRTPEEKEMRRVRKKGTRKFMYSASDIRMSSTDKITDNGSESSERGAHYNPTFTQL